MNNKSKKHAQCYSTAILDFAMDSFSFPLLFCVISHFVGILPESVVWDERFILRSYLNRQHNVMSQYF